MNSCRPSISNLTGMLQAAPQLGTGRAAADLEDRGAIPHSHSRCPAWPVKKPNGCWQIMADDQQSNASTNCLSLFRSNQCQHEPNASAWIPLTFKCSSFPRPWHLGMHSRSKRHVTPHTPGMQDGNSASLKKILMQNCQINNLH